ncbi:MAG: HDOD domain-containing protein [Pirellulales bacterium]|nr:HDOD domain-containing protein [Pirellulales bacterium]
MSVVGATPSQLDELAARAGALYTLPAVAVEVLQLTDNPRVDVRALKQCIERDPALTAKLLRVVNSSLFGLSREVGDLNQALALLGVKPLKMLVLGFSLPETLFADAGREQLDWYWRHTLARAVAAREICEQALKRPGDDVFVAALLQDIGVLVLLAELGPPYAKFLGEVIVQRANFHRVQVDELGFDHTELSVKLLERWRMPRTLVDAIAEPRIVKRLAKLDAPHATACRALHLAELTAQLVAERRLSALPDLLEAGEAYFDWDRARFDELIAALEPKVAQLAEVLSVPLEDAEAYATIVAEAHRQMSILAEESAADMALRESALGRSATAPALAAAAEPVRDALDEYLLRQDHALANLAGWSPGATSVSSAFDRAAPRPSQPPAPAGPSLSLSAGALATRFTLAVGTCRSQRQSLSTLAIAVEPEDDSDAVGPTKVRDLILRVWRQGEHAEPLLPTDDAAVQIALLPTCDRRQAAAAANDFVRRLRAAVDRLVDAERFSPYRISAGVATVNVPARNFPPQTLLEAALRCLAASQRSQGAVKSIEIS